jgi:exopolysaccharide production protein ExoZ
MLSGLQALRFVAALGVVAHHCHPTFWTGAAGVDIFFVISGFVIVVSSNRLFQAPSAARHFMVRRIVRIVPLYWIMTMTEVRIEHFHHFGTIARSLLFVPVDTHGFHFPFLTVGWTLNFEMYFYTAFAACLAMSKERALATLTVVFVTLAAAGSVLGISLTLMGFYFTNPLSLEFICGGWLGIAYLRGFRVPNLVAVVLAAAGVATIYFSAPGGNDFGYRLIEWGVPALAIVAGLTLGQQIDPKTATGRILCRAGDVSYALYLTHLPLIMIMSPRGIPHWQMFCVSVIGGVAVHFFIERPLQLLLRSMLANKSWSLTRHGLKIRDRRFRPAGEPASNW